MQNLIHILILLVVALIFISLAPKPNLEARGLLMPSGPVGKPIPVDSVTLLNHAPTAYKTVGMVRAMTHFGNDSDAALLHDNSENLSLARQLAAQHGANGLIIENISRSADASPLDGVMLQAKAVSIP